MQPNKDGKNISLLQLTRLCEEKENSEVPLIDLADSDSESVHSQKSKMLISYIHVHSTK